MKRFGIPLTLQMYRTFFSMTLTQHEMFSFAQIDTAKASLHTGATRSMLLNTHDVFVGNECFENQLYHTHTEDVQLL